MCIYRTGNGEPVFLTTARAHAARGHVGRSVSGEVRTMRQEIQVCPPNGKVSTLGSACNEFDYKEYISCTKIIGRDPTRAPPMYMDWKRLRRHAGHQ